MLASNGGLLLKEKKKERINPCLTKPFSVTLFTKGDGYHPPVNLKTEPPDTSNWYHSTAMSLLFAYMPKYKHKVQHMKSQSITSLLTS